MPLTFKIRDEENERINNILKKLIGLNYVPKNGMAVIDEVLSGLGLSLQSLLEITPENLLALLQTNNFDWENAVTFADFLVSLAKKLPESQFTLSEKAVAVYQFVQTGSKTFSLEIHQKINAAKNI